MTKIQYPSTSPYAITPQSNWAIGLYKHRPIIASDDDKLLPIAAKYHHNSPLLAADLYGDASLYWVFMLRNMNIFRDPIWGLEAGMEIYIPSKENLRKSSII
jgi:hypothetical protein